MVISFQVLEVCKNFFITQNCFSITTKCKKARSPMLAFVVATSIYTNTLPKFTTLNGEMEVPFKTQHSTTVWNRSCPDCSKSQFIQSFENAAHRYYGFIIRDRICIPNKENHWTCNTFKSGLDCGHVQVLYLLSMLHKDGISIHQTVQSLAMVSFSAMDGSKELVIFRASSNDPKS
jgi:hypothetical protein